MTLFKCPGSSSIIRPKPEYVKCPVCCEDVEIWSDEFKAECPNCGIRIFREQTPSCIEWCSYAKECVGDERYNEYTKNKKSTEH